MKLALFVTGTTGSGKTTLVRRLATMGWSVFCTGDLFRSMGKKINSTESTVAPASFNETVRHHLGLFMAAEFFKPGISLVAVETIPRSDEQIQWLDSFKIMGWEIVMLALDARVDVRTSRVKSRNLTQPADRDHGDAAKLQEELQTWDAFSRSLDLSGYDVRHMDTTLWDHAGDASIPVQCLESMMQAGINLFNARTQHRTDLMPGRMVSRCIDELMEHQLHGNTSTRDQRVEELVDALWFLLLGFKAYGIDARGVYENFMKKAHINNVRHDGGCKPHAGMEE